MKKQLKVSANAVMTIVIIWLLIPLLATIIYSLFEDWTGIVPHGLLWRIIRRSSLILLFSQRCIRPY